MEKTGCKVICGAPTTLVVKGLMMMMMMMTLWLKVLNSTILHFLYFRRKCLLRHRRYTCARLRRSWSAGQHTLQLPCVQVGGAMFRTLMLIGTEDLPRKQMSIESYLNCRHHTSSSLSSSNSRGFSRQHSSQCPHGSESNVLNCTLFTCCKLGISGLIVHLGYAVI